MGLVELRRCWGLFSVAAVGVPFVVLAGPAHAQDVRTVEPVFERTSGKALSVSVGDMDGDGIVDLVTPNRSGGVDLLRGQGGGGYAEPQRIAGPGVRLGDSVVADFDGDGLLDLAVGQQRLMVEAGLRVLRGLGDGLLDKAVSYPLASVPDRLTVADVNGDGDPDLLAVLPGSDEVAVLLGEKGITFSAPAAVAVGAFPRGLDVADTNRDGHLDLAVANRESNTVSVRFGDGTGSFPTGAEVAVRPAPQDVELADLEGDGIVDLVVGSNGEPVADTGTLAVLRGSGPTDFTEIRTYETLKSINSVTAADFDEDGSPDFVIGSGSGPGGPQAPGYVSVVAGQPGSTDEIVVCKVGESATDVTVADLDGDGDLDAVTTRGLNYLAIVFDPLG